MAIAFLIAGTLLTTAVTTMVPAAYAKEVKTEDDSIAQQNDCDDNKFDGDPSFSQLCQNDATNGGG